MLRREDCNLRKLKEDDLELVLIWRNKEEIRKNMYTDHVISMDEHTTWFKRVKNVPTNKHMIFTYKEKPMGVVNITQIDHENSKCYWGFYLGYVGATQWSGGGLAMGYCGLKYIFEVLSIRKLCSEVFTFNIASVQYHKKLGFIEEGCLKKHILKHGIFQDILCLALFKDNWLDNKNNIANQCFDGDEY